MTGQVQICYITEGTVTADYYHTRGRIHTGSKEEGGEDDEEDGVEEGKKSTARYHNTHKHKIQKLARWILTSEPC